MNDIIWYLNGWLSSLSPKGKSEEEGKCSSWKGSKNLFF